MKDREGKQVFSPTVEMVANMLAFWILLVILCSVVALVAPWVGITSLTTFKWLVILVTIILGVALVRDTRLKNYNKRMGHNSVREEGPPVSTTRNYNDCRRSNKESAKI